MTTADEQANKH